MTREIKLKIFAQHIGQKVYAKHFGDGILTCVDICNSKYPLWFNGAKKENEEFTTKVCLRARGRHLVSCAIILKSLANITEKDALWLLNRRISNLKEYPHHFLKASVTDNGYLVIEYFWENVRTEAFPTFWFGQVEIDYLRSKGYATTYMGYSVEELVKFGVYKLI